MLRSIKRTQCTLDLALNRLELGLRITALEDPPVVVKAVVDLLQAAVQSRLDLLKDYNRLAKQSTGKVATRNLTSRLEFFLLLRTELLAEQLNERGLAFFSIIIFQSALIHGFP